MLYERWQQVVAEKKNEIALRARAAGNYSGAGLHRKSRRKRSRREAPSVWRGSAAGSNSGQVSDPLGAGRERRGGDGDHGNNREAELRLRRSRSALRG